MSADAGGAPPRWWDLLLRLVLGDGVRGRSIRGDLREEHGVEVRERGRRAAGWWYRRQAAGVVVRSLAGRLGRAAGEGSRQEPRGIRSLTGGDMMAEWWRDLMHSARSLARSPGFAAVVVVTLALGIGANTAIFTVVDRVLLRPLPIEGEDRVVRVYTSDFSSGPYGTSSYPDFESFRESASSLESLAAFSFPFRVGVAGGDVAEVRTALLASPGYWEVLGLRPAAGRFYGEAEAGTRVAVLSHGTWRREHAGDPEVLGGTIRVNGVPFTVVGIAPAGFTGIEVGVQPDLWIPLSEVDTALPGAGAEILDRRGSRWLDLVGRLAPGATEERAALEVNAIMAGLAAEFPDSNLGTRDRPDEARPMAVVPVRRGAVGAGDFDEALRVATLLVVIVGLVLLIACANVANLLLVRGDRRRREMAVRTALGASRGRLIRSQLAESLLLGLAGGAAGVVLAELLARALVAFELEPVLQGVVRLENVATDGRVLLFTLGLSLATGVLFGVVPALRASRPDLVPALKGAMSATRGPRRWGLRDVLVVAQVAVSLVLLVGAGLFTRSALSAYAAELGFDPRGVAVADVDPSLQRMEPDRTRAFYDEVLDRVAALPGVESAALAALVPVHPGGIRGGHDIEGVGPEGTVNGRPRFPEINVNMVSPGYFETMRIPLLQGRTFRAADDADAERVAVVNQAFVDAFWPDWNPLARRIRRPGDSTWIRVVGVVATSKYRSVREEPLPFIYRPLAQEPEAASVLARTGGDPAGLIPSIRATVREAGAGMPVLSARTLRDQLDGALVQERALASLLTLMAALALTLAAVGLYGIMAYSVTQRTHEIGVRGALGASRRTVLMGVLRRGLLLTGAGVALGLAGAYGLSRLVRGFIAGVEATDPVTFAGVTAVLGAVALIAAYVPARRASRVDPMIALRYE